MSLGEDVVARIKVLTELDTKGLKSGSSEVDKEVSGIEKKFGGLGKALPIAGAAAAAGVAIVADQLFEAVEAAAKYQVVNARIKVNLKDAGLSWKKYGGQIDDTITSMSEASGFARVDLADAFSNMVRTTGNVSKAFKDLHLAMDVARTKGMSLAQSQQLVAKVSNGSFIGLKKLGIAVTPVTTAYDKLTKQHDKLVKSGTKFNADQDAAYRAQVKAAKATDKQATSDAALALIKQKLGGQSAAYAKTFQGEMEIAANDVDILKEKIGEKLLPYVQKLLAWVIKFTKSKEFHKWMAEAGHDADVFGHAIAVVAQSKAFQVYVGTIITYIKTMGQVFGDEVRLIDALVHGKWSDAWQQAKNVVADVFSGIKGIFGGITNAIWNPIRSVLNYGLGLLNSIIGKINSVIDSIPGHTHLGLHEIPTVGMIGGGGIGNVSGPVSGGAGGSHGPSQRAVSITQNFNGGVSATNALTQARAAATAVFA